MDDDKHRSLLEQFTDAVKEVVETATPAATKALEPEPSDPIAFVQPPMAEPTMPPFVLIPRGHKTSALKRAPKPSRAKKSETEPSKTRQRKR
jgi:hypothetical protein